MDHTLAIKNNYLTIHDHFIPLMLKTEESLLRDRVVKEINPIIWITWHILRSEDMFLSTVVFNEIQEFHKGNWMDKLNVATNHTGTGMSVEEVDTLSKNINIVEMLMYNEVVKNRSLQYVDRSKELGDEEYKSEEDIYQSLHEADVFPEGVKQERAKAYSKYSLSNGIVGILMHGYMHIGQYMLITKPL